jgi:hypothetical protein
VTSVDRITARYLANWQDEIDSAALYRAVAEVEPQAQLAMVYRKLAETEETHARFWEEKLLAAGTPPPPPRVGWRTRILAFLAQRFGPSFVLLKTWYKVMTEKGRWPLLPHGRVNRPGLIRRQGA